MNRKHLFGIILLANILFVYGSTFFHENSHRVVNAYGGARTELLNYTYETAHLETTKEYLMKNWELYATDAYTNIYRKKLDREQKRFFAPMLYASITAGGRLQLHRLLMQLKPKNVLYTDTDSILHICKKSCACENFKYSTDLGSLKIVRKNAELWIYGKKTYTWEDESHTSGARSTPEMLKSGLITQQRMRTLATTTNLADLGTFTTETTTVEYEELTEPDSLTIDEPLLTNTHVQNYLLTNHGER